MPSIIDVLEECYGECLELGRERAFYEFSPAKAEAVFDRYREVVKEQELANTKTKLANRSLLLAQAMTPSMTRSAGGHHVLGDDEGNLYRESRGVVESKRPPRLPGETFVAYSSRTFGLAVPDYTEDDVRAHRIENLKTLLLLAPSITLPDQVWMLSAEAMIQTEARPHYLFELKRRWAAYMTFLASIRTLIDQGAVRIVSARRMSDIIELDPGKSFIAEFEDRAYKLRRILNNLEQQIHKQFVRHSNEYSATMDTLKYVVSLSHYNCSAFYERQESVKVHEAILRERLGLLSKNARALYMPQPARFSTAVMQAAKRLSVSDLAEARLHEKRLEVWFRCYKQALEAQDAKEFEEHLKMGMSNFDKLSSNVVDKSKQLLVANGINLGAKYGIKQLFASLLLPDVAAWLAAQAVHPIVKPLIAEFTDPAPENDLQARSKAALEEHFKAALEGHFMALLPLNVQN